MVANEGALPLQDGTGRMAEGAIKKRLADKGFGVIDMGRPQGPRAEKVVPIGP
jgi:hypothetical protein